MGESLCCWKVDYCQASDKITYRCSSILLNRSMISQGVATLALGLRPKQGLAKMRAKSESPRVTFYALGNVGKCEGMNPHTPKWTPTLGSWNPNGLPNF
jgi:hypothetical protein